MQPLIDPKGNLLDTILSRTAPEHASRIVVLEDIVDQRIGHSLQSAALLSSGVRPAGAREFRERDRSGGGVAETGIEGRIRIEMHARGRCAAAR